MKRVAVFVVLVLASCAKREEKQESPAPPPPATAVAPVKPGFKYQNIPVMKPPVNHIPGKDEPAAASASAAPSAK